MINEITSFFVIQFDFAWNEAWPWGLNKRSPEMASEDSMLYTIAVVLIVLWLLGFVAHVGGGLIHLLLVIAVIVIIYRLVTGRRAL
jgi:hypothetical protein